MIFISNPPFLRITWKCHRILAENKFLKKILAVPSHVEKLNFPKKSNDFVDNFVLFAYNKTIKKRSHGKEVDLMSITSTELKLNLGKYLKLAEHEDIFITRNGKIVAKLSNPNADRVEMAKSLLGVFPADITLEEARAERADKL